MKNIYRQYGGVFNYSNSVYYSDYSSYFESFYKENGLPLNQCYSNHQLIKQFLLNTLNLNTAALAKHEFPVMSKKSNLILDICRNISATTYLSGPFGRHYLDCGNTFDAFKKDRLVEK